VRQNEVESASLSGSGRWLVRCSGSGRLGDGGDRCACSDGCSSTVVCVTYGVLPGWCRHKGDGDGVGESANELF
jgi:hypothetical protein